MRFEGFSFGLMRIDAIRYEHDVVIDLLLGKHIRETKKSS
jgi:hypothetical protein